MRLRSPIFGALLVALAPAVAAQVPSAPGGTFRAQAELVLVPVVVTHSGHPASELARGAFHLYIDGAERPIASFEQVEAKAAKVQPLQVPAGTFTNIPAIASPTNLTIFLVDTLNSSDGTFHQAHVVNAAQDLLKYLQNRGDLGPLMVMELRRGGLRIVHHYTAPPNTLLADLQNVRSAPMSLEDIPQLRRREFLPFSNAVEFSKTPGAYFAGAYDPDADFTTQIFGQLAGALAGVPGRKTIIWVTGGFADPLMSGNVSGMFREVQYEAAGRALAAANVALYPVHIAPQTYNPAYLEPATVQSLDEVKVNNIRRPLGDTGVYQIMMRFSQPTGGQLCTYRNDLGKCFAKIEEESSNYYLLGFRPSPDTKPGWHGIHVKVDGGGLKVRSRAGYSREAVGPATPRMQINEALASPLDFTGLPLTVKWGAISDAKGKRSASFEVLLRAQSLEMAEQQNNHMEFEVAAVASDNNDGRRAAALKQVVELHPRPATLEKIMSGGIRYHNALELAPGRYLVRIVVRDALSGNMGSVTSTVEVR